MRLHIGYDFDSLFKQSDLEALSFPPDCFNRMIIGVGKKESYEKTNTISSTLIRNMKSLNTLQIIYFNYDFQAPFQLIEPDVEIKNVEILRCEYMPRYEAQ